MKRFWILSLFAVSLSAKDFGQAGESFSIEEESMIESMESKAALHTAKINKYCEELETYIQNPTPIDGIGKAIENRSYFYDPTYTVEEEISVEGRLLAKAGDKINPLEVIDLPGGILFFDGSDPAQVAWARNQPADFKWVLVKGSPIALEEKEGRPVYFDQLGYFTTRFQIRNVPAKVTQEGTFLLIEEISVDEEGSPRP